MQIRLHHYPNIALKVGSIALSVFFPLSSLDFNRSCSDYNRRIDPLVDFGDLHRNSGFVLKGGNYDHDAQ